MQMAKVRKNAIRSRKSSRPSKKRDLTRKADVEVDIQRRLFLTALEPELAKKLTDCARKQGVSTETLINVWLSEKLTETAQAKQ